MIGSRKNPHVEKKQYKCKSRKSRTQEKRHRTIHPVPEQSGHEAGGESHEPDSGIVDAIGAAATVRWHKIGDKSLCHSFGGCVVNAIEREEEPCLIRLIGKTEAQVRKRIAKPADEQHFFTPDAIGQAPQRYGRRGVAEIEERIDERDTQHADSQALRPQDQERIGRISQREDDDNEQENVEGSGKLCADAGGFFRLHFRFPYAEREDAERYEKRDRRQKEDVAVLDGCSDLFRGIGAKKY